MEKYTYLISISLECTLITTSHICHAYVEQFTLCDQLTIISSIGCKQPIGYYCIAQCPSILPPVHPLQNSGMCDTTKTTGLIYLIYFHDEIILSR